jgi:hypothetical protein
MAIAAVYAVVADVVLMAELNRLLFFQISAVRYDDRATWV